MEIIDILNSLEDSKRQLDSLTIELANTSKNKANIEREYNRRLELELEKARQEKIQMAIVKEIVKSRMADLIFEIHMIEAKENYLLNKIRNERSNADILRSIFAFKREELKL